MQRVIGRRALSGEDNTVSKRASRELVVRIYSALFLIAAAVFMTLTSVESFAALITLFIAAMAWEWARLVRGTGVDFAFAAQLAVTAASAWATVRGYPATALLIVLAGTGLAFLIQRFGKGRSRAWWSAGGVAYAGLPAIALIWLRGDEAYGTVAIFYLFAIVWTADSAAFLFGRWIGGPKLAPRISPKKTWAGLTGAVLSAGLIGFVFGIAAGLNSAWLAVFAVAVSLIAQLGDLGESAVKRKFGIKDSSHLIPGHGGVLDRIDGLIFAAIAAAALAWMLDPAQPGRAILFWP